MTSPKPADELLKDVTRYLNEWEGVLAGPGGGPDKLKLEMARFIRSHLQPPGEWQWVPKEPTEEMINAYFATVMRNHGEETARAKYQAMLAAAPSSGDAGKVEEVVNAQIRAAQGARELMLVGPGWNDRMKIIAPVTCVDGLLVCHTDRFVEEQLQANIRRDEIAAEPPAAQGEAARILAEFADADPANWGFIEHLQKAAREAIRHPSPVAQWEANQKAVYQWAVDTFGEHATIKTERAARLVEESIELAQAVGLPHGIITKLTERVYSRPVGDVPRELGGVVLTVLAAAECLGLSAAEEGRREFDRVLNLPKDHFQRKVAEKEAAGVENIARHPSHPTGSVDLAQAVKDAERNGANRALRTLAIALEKFAPHLGLELTKLWNVAISEQEHALHEFLSAILTKEEYAAFKSAPPKPTAPDGGGL